MTALYPFAGDTQLIHAGRDPDSVTICVKSPSVPGDKHVLDEAAFE